MPALLHGSIETMLWVHYNLRHNTTARLTPDPGEPGIVFAYNDLLKSMSSDFSSAEALSLFQRTEASSLSALTVALESLTDREILSVQEKSGEPKRLLVKKEANEEFDLLKEISLKIRQCADVN